MYIDIEVAGGTGAYCVLKDAKIAGTTPGQGEYSHVAVFFLQLQQLLDNILLAGDPKEDSFCQCLARFQASNHQPAHCPMDWARQPG